ncbi:uncharacterized protein V3H82_024895 isoform 2-T2 [Fundulus diaphanus]
MLHFKKYSTKGLVQMAILLSLCGVRVDVGLESYLTCSWHEMVLSQNSALTQTRFRNQHSLGPKSVDLEQFFTARRLLGWVHSLDRMQVPQAELETWLVQREPGPLIGGFPDQHSLMDRAPGEIERVQSEPTIEQGAVLGSLEEEERIDVDRSDELECQSFDTEPLVSSVMLPENQPLDLDLELQWQDLMDILEPENTDVEMMTSLNHTPVSRRPGTIQGDGCEAPPQNSNITGNAGTVAHQINLFTGTPLQRDLLGTSDQLDQEPVLLSLTPSDELDDHSLVLNTELTLEDSNMDSWVIPSNYTDLQAENPVEGFDKGINTEVNLTTLGMNLLTQDFISFESDFYSYDLKPPSYSQASEGNNLNQDFNITSSSLLAEEDADSFPGQINDLLEDDCNILEDIKMLDEALEDRFSPEMAVKLKEEGYLHCEGAHQGTDRGCNSMEAQRQPNTQEGQSSVCFFLLETSRRGWAPCRSHTWGLEEAKS